jgi:hypothetical protein
MLQRVEQASSLNMRLFVSASPFNIPISEIQARFQALGGKVSVSVPIERRLGDEVIRRPFIHLELSGVSDAAAKQLAHAVREPHTMSSAVPVSPT